MPFRRTYRKRTARKFIPNNRRITRRRRPMARRGRVMRIPRTITPDSKMIKLRYCLGATLNPGSGETSMLSIKANDLYAPGGGTGAHQPMGFDQIMSLYESFCVVGSKIHVAFIANSATDASVVGIATRNSTEVESVQDNTGTATNEGVLERNHTVWKYMGATDNGASPAQVRSKFSTKKFFSVPSINSQPNNAFSNTNMSLWGSATASPTILGFYNIFCAPFSDTVDTSFRIRVTIEYAAVFKGRKLLGQS